MKKIILALLLTITSISWGATYYVATPANGGSNSNPGTLAQPFATWQYAIDQMESGDTTFVRGGVYYITGTNNFVFIDGTASGTASERCFFGAYQPDFDAGNYPILDCDAALESYQTNYSAFGFNAVQYWHVKGITVRKAWQRGVANRRAQGIGGTNSANMIFENCTTHDITGRGFYYESGAWNTWDAEFANPTNPVYALWDSDTTYFINCDTYNICDSANNSSGDGWKCGNYFGGVIYFTGCRAWNYADDGFDPGGAGKRIFTNCWAMSTDKYVGLGGIEGNGFKTGAIGEEQAPYYPAGYSFVEMSNCLAAHNFGYGFYNNLELGADNNAQYFNNTSYHNYGGYFDVPLVLVNTRGLEMRNNIAYNNSSQDYEQVGIYNPSVYTESNNTWIATQETGAGSWPGWVLNNNYTITNADFVSLDSSQIRLPRKSDWSLPDITFLKLASTSDLIDGGVDVGLPFNGSAPDLGYAEYGDAEASDATDIVSFYLAAQIGGATINTTNHIVSIEVESGTNVTSLTPTIGLSYGATINPTSGTARNFTSPVTYTVTAEDGITQQVWTITVTIAEAPVTGTVVVSNNHFIIHNGQVVLL